MRRANDGDRRSVDELVRQIREIQAGIPGPCRVEVLERFPESHVECVLGEPSAAEPAITKRLAEALALVDVHLINHFVVGDGEVCSFAERGWL